MRRHGNGTIRLYSSIATKDKFIYIIIHCNATRKLNVEKWKTKLRYYLNRVHSITSPVDYYLNHEINF